MKWLKDVFKRPQKQAASIRANPSRDSLPEGWARGLASRRTISSVRGNFALTPRHTHTIKVDHLRPLPEDDFPPWRSFPTATHQLWVIYRGRDDKPVILISLQFDFGVTGDYIAREILLLLPQAVIDSQTLEAAFLIRLSDRSADAKIERMRYAWWAYQIDKLFNKVKNRLKGH